MTQSKFVAIKSFAKVAHSLAVWGYILLNIRELFGYLTGMFPNAEIRKSISVSTKIVRRNAETLRAWISHYPSNVLHPKCATPRLGSDRGISPRG